MNNTTVRLDKYLANLGVCARRAVDALLQNKTVTVNGKRIMQSGIRISPLTDTVLINGAKLKKPILKYYLLNKPKGYVSTTADKHAKKHVISLIKTSERIYPVGRLDKDTTGLLILTNDGKLTNLITHPRYQQSKTYKVIISGQITGEQMRRLQTGVHLEDGKTSPAEIKLIKKSPMQSIITMTIHEGRNRQIRRMCKSVGVKLLELERIAIGKLRANLKPGQYRELSKSELDLLKQIVQVKRSHPANDRQFLKSIKK